MNFEISLESKKDVLTGLEDQGHDKHPLAPHYCFSIIYDQIFIPSSNVSSIFQGFPLEVAAAGLKK